MYPTRKLLTHLVHFSEFAFIMHLLSAIDCRAATLTVASFFKARVASRLSSPEHAYKFITDSDEAAYKFITDSGEAA